MENSLSSIHSNKSNFNNYSEHSIQNSTFLSISQLNVSKEHEPGMNWFLRFVITSFCLFMADKLIIIMRSMKIDY